MGRCNDWGWLGGVSRAQQRGLQLLSSHATTCPSATGALAFLSGCGVEMADSDGERIGSVGGLWNLIEIQKPRHHLLDLMLFRPAVSNHRRLDREWGVFGDFESGGSRGQHGDTAYLPQLQGRLHVGGIENVFDRDAVGAMLGD